MDYFEEIVDVGASQSLLFATSSVKFGDGYSQVAELGLKPTQQSWNISMTDTKARTHQALRFFNDHRGVKPFYWVNPFGETLKVTVDNVRLTGPDEGGIYVLEATFTEEV
ncbi:MULTISPECIES: phage tail protein [Oligella]|uniref:Phage-related protein n=1 Tax=Oligella urethralis TaxID=90245 RepID=A0A2X1UWD6_9BURK|nr:MULTISPECIES: phage tail protein [Oligella]OFV49694.1 hypothetical protein HMPREF3179_03545 [Oligella sp. HMSC09E12]SPY08023.1 Phage-related protein [Oligella urethralis]